MLSKDEIPLKLNTMTSTVDINDVKTPSSENHLIYNGKVSLNTTVYPLKNAETIMLLHGGPGVPDPMLEVARELNKKFQVITFEQRGTGNSVCPAKGYKLEDYCSDIDAIADYFQLDTFHLFGHSWGGLYAQVYAQENPARIKSLFLCSPSSGTNQTWKATEREVMASNKRAASNWEWMKMGWYSLLGMLGADRAYRKLFKLVLQNYHKGYLPIRVSEEQLKGIKAESINQTRKQILSYKALHPFQDPPFAVAVTYGDGDIYGKSKQAVIDRFPTGKLFEIEKSGHIPWVHNPQRFMPVLDSFYGIENTFEPTGLPQRDDTTASAVNAGRDPLASIDLQLDREIENGRSPSVQYYLFDSENIIKYYRSGFSKLEMQQQAGADTTYHAFSVTKTFTALAILQLVEQGLIKLDSPVISYLPEFPYGTEITVQHLLNHSAGILNPIPLSWIHLAAEHRHFDQQDFIHKIFSKYAKTKSKPNEKFQYSNLGYLVLGQLIERISGKSYEAYITDNIFARLPLDANDLSFSIANANRHATGYHKRWSFSNLILGFFLDKATFMQKSSRRWNSFKPNYVNGAAYGGLIGKPIAFVKYIQELLKNDSALISVASKRLLFRENKNNQQENTGMSLSWFTGRLHGKTYFAHAGGGGGYYCEIRIYPDEGLGSVIFFNRTGMKDERYLDKLDVAYFSKPQRTNGTSIKHKTGTTHPS